MLQITIEPGEFFNHETEEFVQTPGQTLELEHSLISISKWESIFRKPFLTKEEKTPEELKAYVKNMTITRVTDPRVYDGLTDEQYAIIKDYITTDMTATTFSRMGNETVGTTKIITTEVIYYWMIALNIPAQYDKWHLSRLLTLIQVVNEKSNPNKKSTMSRSEMIAQRRSLNAARKNALGTTG